MGEVVGTFPRETRLGPFSGKLWSRLELGDNQYWVHRRFRKDVEAADATLPEVDNGEPESEN